MAFTSGVEVVSGESDVKLPPSGTVEPTPLGALFVIRLGNVSEGKLKGGTGGRLEGKLEPGNELKVKMAELAVAGNKGDGYSGKFEVGKFEEGKFEVGKFEEGKFEVGKFEVGRFEVGKFGVVKFEAPAGKDALKPGYCIGCCIEGGIDSPGGGLSKDCWCN